MSHTRELFFLCIQSIVLSTILFLLSFSLVSAATITLPPNNLGLVGYWTFDDASGDTATDSSGNNNTGTLTGDPVWTSGKKGGALEFDGVDDYVALPSSASLKGQSAVTVSLWYQPNQTPSEEAGIYYESTSDANYTRLGFFHNTSDGLSAVSRDNETGGAYAINQADFFTPGEWYHLVMTYDANSEEFVLYSNGIELGSNTTAKGVLTGTDSAAGVSIGRYYSTVLPGYVNGQIDDVRIYNRALTSTDIQALYNSGTTKRKTVSETNLVGHWTFDDASGDTATDSSGNNNTGTLTGDPVWTSGKKGGALEFDGSGDYINAGDVDSVDGLSTVTVAMWVKPESSIFGLAIDKAQSSSQSRLSIENSSELAPKFYISNSGGVSFGTLEQNKWAHLIGTYDGVTMKTYVNGSLVNSSALSTTVSDTSNPLLIGGRNSANPLYFTGLIDDVRIYNTALSAEEVQTLYNETQITINSSQNNKLTDGLVGLWSFDGPDVAITQGGGGDYVVSGASLSDFNGTYTQDGTHTTIGGSPGTYPQYKLDATHWLFFDYDEWLLDYDTTTLSCPAYGTGGDPITGTWTNYGCVDSGSAPTVTEAASGSATAYDRSGNGNDGTLTNGPTPDRGIIGQAMRFDGSDDYVSVADDASLDFGAVTDFSASVWIKYTSSATDYTGIVVKAESISSWNGWQLVLVGDNIAAEIGDGSSVIGVSQGLQGSTNLSDGNWHFLTLVAERATNYVRLYVDGVQEASVSNSVFGNDNDNTASVLVGTERTSVLFFDGLIDNVRIYNKALSVDEVMQLYKMGARE